MTDNNTNNNTNLDEQKNDMLNEVNVQQPETTTSNNTVGTESKPYIKQPDNSKKIESLKSFKKWMNITYILSIIGIVFMVLSCFLMPVYLIVAGLSGFLAYLLYKIIDETKKVIEKLENNEDVVEDNYIEILLKVKDYFKWSFIITISTVILMVMLMLVFFIFFASTLQDAFGSYSPIG